MYEKNGDIILLQLFIEANRHNSLFYEFKINIFEGTINKERLNGK